MNRAGIGILAVVCIFIAAACSSTHHAATRRGTPIAITKGAKEPGVSFDPTVPSRDGKRIAVVKHVGYTAYLKVGPAGGGARHTIFSSANSCCTDVVWASHDLIAFDDGFEVKTIDVPTRRVRGLIGAMDFTLSSDGRWVAWSKSGGPEGTDSVGVVPITGGECLLVPRPKDAGDLLPYFHPGGNRLYFLREFANRPHSRIISAPISSLKRAPAGAC